MRDLSNHLNTITGLNLWLELRLKNVSVIITPKNQLQFTVATLRFLALNFAASVRMESSCSGLLQI